MMKYILSFIFFSVSTVNGYSQIVRAKGPDSWVLRNCNIVYTKPQGWEAMDSTFNDKPLAHYFLNKHVARSGIYNVKKDIYMILGSQAIRSWPGLLSDSAVNNNYLTQDYTSQHDLILLHKNRMPFSLLEEVNVDDVAAYRMKLDTPFLGKYHYAKKFLLHKQDVANVSLNFIALNKGKEKEINRLFRKLWGMVRFRPDSAYHPMFKNGLVGKFRSLRPGLNTADSLKNVRNRKRMHFRVAVFNGKSAVKAKNYKQAKEDFLTASHILPDNPYPIKQICRMYLHHDQLDSATVYLAKLQRDYLSQNPKLLSEIKYGRALWYEKRGMYDSAIVVNKQLLKLRPENAGHIYFALGECYEQLSNRQLAKKYFKKAQEEGYALPEEVKEKYEL